MQIFKNLKSEHKQMLVIGGVIAGAVVVSGFFSSDRPLATLISNFNKDEVSSVSYSEPMRGGELPAFEGAERGMDMSIYPPRYGYVSGVEAEDFEIREYYATIKTSRLQADCDLLANLKNDVDIIFENANRSEFGCDYTFKVKQDKVSLVLEKIALLDPEALNENTRTIKAEVDYYADEAKRLTDRLASLDKTLADAIASYDAVARTATANGDVSALAQVIDSKLAMMERIEQSRTDILAQLEQIKKGESEVLEKMDFVYFYVNVYKDAIVEGDSLKDSWFVALKELVTASNQLLQDVTVGLVTFVFQIAKFALYAGLVLLVAKPAYKLARRFWME